MGNQGSCGDLCGGEGQLRQPWKQQSQQMLLEYDARNEMIKSSYQIIEGPNIFRKVLYNWHSIPIITLINENRSQHFEVRNRGIENNNFVIGIIKKQAIIQRVSRPWQSTNCLCYESHSEIGGSSIVYNGNRLREGVRDIRRDQIVRVQITPTGIIFRINDENLGFHALPPELRTGIVPYVALFGQNDKIEFITPINPV